MANPVQISPEGVRSQMNYCDQSNIELQELCEDIDFDFDTLDDSNIVHLQCMYTEKDRIQWLQIVKEEREAGA